MADFTLHRPGAGFVSSLCIHEQAFKGPERLLFIDRSKSEKAEMLQSGLT